MAKRAEELQQSVDDLVEIGRLYHELEKFQSAINKYLEAEKLGYEEKWLLYAAISDCYLSLKDVSQARSYLEQAIRCNPEKEYVKEVRRKYEERFGG